MFSPSKLDEKARDFHNKFVYVKLCTSVFFFFVEALDTDYFCVSGIQVKSFVFVVIAALFAHVANSKDSSNSVQAYTYQLSITSHYLLLHCNSDSSLRPPHLSRHEPISQPCLWKHIPYLALRKLQTTTNQTHKAVRHCLFEFRWFETKKSTAQLHIRSVLPYEKRNAWRTMWGEQFSHFMILAFYFFYDSLPTFIMDSSVFAVHSFCRAVVAAALSPIAFVPAALCDLYNVVRWPQLRQCVRVENPNRWTVRGILFRAPLVFPPFSTARIARHCYMPPRSFFFPLDVSLIHFWRFAIIGRQLVAVRVYAHSKCMFA